MADLNRVSFGARAGLRWSMTAGLLTLLLVLSACGRKPGQPYVVTGEISIKADFNVDPDAISERGGRVDLMMTVRSGPNIGDVLAQRRWSGIGSRHHFGIGKGEDFVKRIKLKTDRIYVTALLDIFDRGDQRITRSYVGWTRDAVPVGQDDLRLEIDYAYGQADPRTVKNFPVGGWYSPSATEEAPPPGTPQINPGAKVFSGTIDVPEDLRYAFRQFVLYVGAGDDPKATREFELRIRHDTPSFPLKFSLNQNHTSKRTAIAIDKAKLVVAILDFDGNLGTVEDQCRVWTKDPVDPQTADIELIIDPKAMLDFIMKNRQKGANNSSSKTIDAKDARSVAKGRLTIDDDLKANIKPETSLWLTVRNAATDALQLVKKLEPEFPQDFEINEADTMGMSAVKIDGAFVVRAILTDGDPSAKEGVIRVTSETIPAVGATGLDLHIKKN